MKILMVSHYILPHNGGIEIIVEELSSALASNGHDVRVIGGVVEQPSHSVQGSREIISFKVWDPLKRFGAHYPLYPPAAFRAVRAGVQWADVVHVQGMLYPNSLLAARAARIEGKPVILTEHAAFVPYQGLALNFLQRVAINSVGKACLRMADLVIVPDTIVKNLLTQRLHLEAGKIVQIPLGVDTDYFLPGTVEMKRQIRSELGWDDRPRVLFVGNFVARKRIPLLLAAAAPDYTIVLCGEGIPPKPLPPETMVYPAMGHTQLTKLYQAADLFVVPSSVETFAIVAFEAMACGLPVIMTDDLRHLTIAQSGLVTFVHPTPGDLQVAIRSLNADPQKRQRLAKASRDWVSANYSWRRTTNDHVAVYADQLGRATSRRAEA